MKRAVPLVASLGLLLVSCSTASTPTHDPLIGSWQGDGRIIVTWCEQERLPIALEIDGEHVVSGTVGDATLVDGELRSNRGRLGRALNVKTDWIVVADLEGPLVAAEDIRRDGIKLPLNLSDEILRGAAHSTGSHWGGKGSMVLTAASVVLRRR